MILNGLLRTFSLAPARGTAVARVTSRFHARATSRHSGGTPRRSEIGRRKFVVLNNSAIKR